MNVWQLNSPKILPLVYDEALSYGEQIALWVDRIEKLKADVITIANEISYWNNQLQDVISDQKELGIQIKLIQNSLTAVNENISTLDSQLSAILKEVYSNKANINELRLRLDQQVYDILDVINKNFATTNNLCNDIKNLFIEYLTTQNGYLIQVRNPMNGLIDNLNSTLQDMLYFIQDFGGITMKEYASLNLTMEEYAAYHLTFIQYNMSAFFYFFPIVIKRWFNGEVKEYIDSQINPIKEQVENTTQTYSLMTGQKIPVNDYSDSIIDLMTWGLTMDDYENLKLTPDEYAKLTLDVQSYDILGIPAIYTLRYNIDGLTNVTIGANMNTIEFIYAVETNGTEVNITLPTIPSSKAITRFYQLLYSSQENITVESENEITVSNVKNNRLIFIEKWVKSF